MGKEPEKDAAELSSGKNSWRKKLGVLSDPAVLAATLGGSVAAASLLTLDSIKADELAEKRAGEALQSIETVARGENAQNTVAAIKKQKDDSASRVKKSTSAEGWAANGELFSGALFLGAGVASFRRIGKNLDVKIEANKGDKGRG